MRITLIANVNIDSEIRLQHMKDSFLSFNNSIVINEYIINLRGKYAAEASSFLKQTTACNINIFHLESLKGWFYDTQELFQFVSNNTIFYWVEDHICLDLDFFDRVISDFIKFEIDYLQTSFWLNGLLLNQFSGIKMQEGGNMFFFEHNTVTHLNFKKRYINSLTGIYSKTLFSKIIFCKNFVKLWPSYLPFDFERPSWDTSIFPFVRGVAKNEIFASIDDCQDVPGSSLISRGIYGQTTSRISTAFIEKSKTFKLLIMIRKQLRPLKKLYLFMICFFNTPINLLFDYFK